MKISKKIRDEAIHILDVLASHSIDTGRHISIHYIDDYLWISAAAHSLAWSAYESVDGTDTQARGDAAGLLRDGWSPGDPVVDLLGGE